MDFWSEFIKIIVSNGIFAMLFVFLFIYQLRDSAKREMEYKNIIDNLFQHLEVIEDVKEEINELKDMFVGRDDNEWEI